MMDNFISFPTPPNNPQFGQQLNYQQPMYTQQSYTTDGRPVQIETYSPQPQQSGSMLGANFSRLVGTQVTSPISNVNTETPKKNTRKKKKDGSESTELAVSENTSLDGPVNSKEIVENTVYADTYSSTNAMTYGIIAQTDELLRESKMDLDYIRSQRNMKGKYHYMNATLASMSSLMSTKLAAIKEINSTIKAVNDNEYRRFKDMRALDQTNDNKAVMDAYSAFISAPLGAPSYQQPGTMNLTGGLNGVIRADYPADVQKNMDIGMANYLASLTPEENLMVNDSNPNIEEVLVYDEASGVKTFRWINTLTNEFIPNMPPSSNLVVEDFVVDPRTRLAKNTNLNMIKKVVVINEGKFDRF